MADLCIAEFGRLGGGSSSRCAVTLPQRTWRATMMTRKYPNIGGRRIKYRRNGSGRSYRQSVTGFGTPPAGSHDGSPARKLSLR